MKVHVDEVLCSGHGRCFVLAKDVYKLDDDGYNAERGATVAVTPGLEAQAMLGLNNCPEAAISLAED